MWPGVHAETRPEKVAYVMAGSGEAVTYRELNDRSNQLAQLFAAAGIGFGDHIAIVMENNPRFLEICWAAQRAGLYYTAINWRLNLDEVNYILGDCDARALIVSDSIRDLAGKLLDVMPPAVDIRLAAGSEVPGYEPYEDAIARYPAEPIDDEVEGHAMLYSSGTTGYPKGIKYKLERRPIGDAPLAVDTFKAIYGMSEDSVYLSPAPLYHSAPLQFSMVVLRLGATVVIMEKFDPIDALRAIERYRVTHSQWVPTMFVRMLKLPEEVRNSIDVSSMQCAIHAAAPCPVPIKKQMIEWWGPIICEYYSATEGIGATMIDSHEWLEHKGSVGRSMLSAVHVLDDEGNELPPGEPGVIWFEPHGGLSFEYHNDPDKTAQVHNEYGWATVGDVGYVDEDGYLYLTDRATFMIVSGGVNIYPQEAENLLVTHPKVMDAAVFGIPDDEMGEAVHAVVQPLEWDDAGDDLERELIAFCRDNLAHYKCPGRIDFEAELPRHDTGKLYKRQLRDRYWGDRASRIV
jgi:long-chain acyl-CoA synthetase